VELRWKIKYIADPFSSYLSVLSDLMFNAQETSLITLHAPDRGLIQSSSTPCLMKNTNCLLSKEITHQKLLLSPADLANP
jgi:hypothetical protein